MQRSPPSSSPVIVPRIANKPGPNTLRVHVRRIELLKRRHCVRELPRPLLFLPSNFNRAMLPTRNLPSTNFQPRNVPTPDIFPPNFLYQTRPRHFNLAIDSKCLQNYPLNWTMLPIISTPNYRIQTVTKTTFNVAHSNFQISPQTTDIHVKLTTSAKLTRPHNFIDQTARNSTTTLFSIPPKLASTVQLQPHPSSVMLATKRVFHNNNHRFDFDECRFRPRLVRVCFPGRLRHRRRPIFFFFLPHRAVP